MEAARACCPGNLPSLTDEELTTNLLVLQGISLPAPVRAGLVARHASRLKDAAEGDATQIGEFVAVVRPWILDSEKTKAVDPSVQTTWLLSGLVDLGDMARVTWFQDTCVRNFLIPLVGQGAARANIVSRFITTLLDEWAAHADKVDLDDESIDALCRTLDLCRAIKTIIGMSWANLIDAPWPDLVLLSRQHAPAGNDAEVLLAIWRGRQHMVQYSPLPSDGSQEGGR